MRTKRFFSVVVWIFVYFFPSVFIGEAKQEVRHYMPFNYPMDPAKFICHADMKVSYAVASTLVEWSSSKQLTGGLASDFKKMGDKVVFKLREGARWSNGEQVKSVDVKRSFERALKENPTELRSLKSILEKIETPDSRTVVFHLNGSALEIDIFQKLTEPNFGVTKVNDNGELDLSISSGAFFVDYFTKDELVLVRNPHWYHFHPRMPKRVVVRQPNFSRDQTKYLLEDDWVNVVETTSIISKEVLKKYDSEGYSIWRRPHDKMYVLVPGKRGGEERFRLLWFLRQNLNKKKITQGFSEDSLEIAEQLFPVGYELHDPEFSCLNDTSEPSSWEGKPIDSLLPEYGVAVGIRERVASAVEEATSGKVRPVAIENYYKQYEEGNYSISGLSYGLADPHSEGVMSSYIEGDLIQSGEGKYNYIKRLDEAREEKDYSKRIKLFRGILRDAECDGRVLPIFHFSTVGIARKGIDLSGLPETDEAVTFSRIRFRDHGV